MKDLKKYYILMIAMFVFFNLLIVYVGFANGEPVFLDLIKDNQTKSIVGTQKQLSETETDKYNNDNGDFSFSKEDKVNSELKKNNTDLESNQSSIQSNLSNKNYSIPFQILPEDKYTSKDKYLYVSGKTLPDVKIKIGSSVTTSNSEGEFSMLIFLSNEKNIFNLEVTDISKDIKLIEDQITYFYKTD